MLWCYFKEKTKKNLSTTKLFPEICKAFKGEFFFFSSWAKVHSCCSNQIFTRTNRGFSDLLSFSQLGRGRSRGLPGLTQKLLACYKADLNIILPWRQRACLDVQIILSFCTFKMLVWAKVKGLDICKAPVNEGNLLKDQGMKIPRNNLSKTKFLLEKQLP